MFTIKFYSDDGYRQIIKEAESFTILRANDGTGEAEITLHRKNPAEDVRYDIKHNLPGAPAGDPWPARFGKAIIENASGRTTEIVALNPNGPAIVKAQMQRDLAPWGDPPAPLVHKEYA